MRLGSVASFRLLLSRQTHRLASLASDYRISNSYRDVRPRACLAILRNSVPSRPFASALVAASSKESSQGGEINKNSKSTGEKPQRQTTTLFSAFGPSWRPIVKSLNAKWPETTKGKKMESRVSEEILEAFESAENPYALTLYMISHTHFHLGALVLKYFTPWIESVADKYTDCLTPELQREAFLLALRHNAYFLDLFVEPFRLEELSEEVLQRDIRKFAHQGRYLQAALAVIVFRLQSQFTLDQVLIPFILQGHRRDYFDRYLRGFPDLQKEAAAILKQLSTSEAEIDRYIKKHNVKLTDSIRRVLCTKALKRVVNRLATTFKLKSLLMENVTSRPSDAATSGDDNAKSAPGEEEQDTQGHVYSLLHRLLHERYVEQSLDKEDFIDFAAMILDKHPEVVHHLIRQLAKPRYNDVKLATHWARTFGISVTSLPAEVQIALDEESSQDPFSRRDIESLFQPDDMAGTQQTSLESSCDPMDKYIRLPKHLFESLVWVNSRELLTELHGRLAKAKSEQALVGLDTEHGLSFTSQPRVSILQIAFADQIYVLDVFALGKLESPLSESEWLSIWRALFCDEKLRKIGFAIRSDLFALAATFPYAKSTVFDTVANTICLQQLHFHFLTENRAFFRPSEPRDARQKKKESRGQRNDQISLATLASYFFPKPLRKKFSVSNWDRRPLLEQQLEYAALDAFCLLEIYEKMRERAESLGIDFEAAVERCVATLGGPPATVVKATATSRDATVTGGENRVPNSYVFSSDADDNSLRADSEAGAMATAEDKKEMHDLLTRLLVQPPGITSKPIADVRLIADRMLGSLARHLRNFGADCDLLPLHVPRQDLITIAKAEQRTILTSGISLSLACGQSLPPLIEVPPVDRSFEAVIWLLRHIRVSVTFDDLFSRCTLCNCNQFVVVAQQHIKLLWDQYKANFENSSVFDRLRFKKTIDLRAVALDDLGPAFETMRTDLGLEKVLFDYDTTEEIIRTSEHFNVCRDCGFVLWDNKTVPRYLNRLRTQLNSACAL